MSSDAEHADDQTEDQTEAAAQATKGAKGTQAAQATQAAAPARQAQGGRAQGTVVADIRLDDPDVVQAVTSLDGKVRITREDLQTGLTADQAQLLWDWAMHQHSRCETAKLVTKRFLSDLETMVAQRGDELLGANRRIVVPPPPHVPANSSDAAKPKDDFLYLEPIRDAMNLNEVPYVPHGTARWQRKLIAVTSVHENRIAQTYRIRFVEDTHTRDGNPYSVNAVTKASYCGAFPHALLFPSVKPRKGIPTYTCSAGLDVVLTIQLESTSLMADGQSPTIVTEQTVLADLKSVLDPREVAAFGRYENTLTFYVELQFAPEEDDLPTHSIDDPDRWVCADSSEHDHRAFEAEPPDKKLLLPYESRPYAGGHYECAMKNGRCEFQFAFNQNVVSKNLHHTKKDRLFRFAVWCLNPYLNGLDSFACYSSPFQIKATLHNDLGRLDRYYANDKGEHVRVDPSAVTRLAPARSCSVAKRAAGTKRALDA